MSVKWIGFVVVIVATLLAQSVVHDRSNQVSEQFRCQAPEVFRVSDRMCYSLQGE